MSPDKLTYMANQIGKFFAHEPHDRAVADIEDHLRKFWDKRMRQTIVESLDSPSTPLDPAPREAVEHLRAAAG